jgi:hypothetical protein
MERKRTLKSKPMKKLLLTTLMLSAAMIYSCENKSLHDADDFKPREIHEELPMNFDKIEIDGVEYLILEKDYNNPHEGFGFMAFRANKMIEKQDTVLAYLKTISDMQVLMYQKLYNVSGLQSRALRDTIFRKNLSLEEYELYQLEQNTNFSKLLPSDRPPLEDN